MIIQHNIPALNSHRNLSINNNATAKNLEKLSSGFRINRAGDDAAGLAISEKMRGQIRGLSMAEQNTSHAINLIQTAEGGLQETHAILQRMRELAVQSSNGTYDDPNDRFNLEKEYQALMEEIDRIAESTHYNNIYLLDGSQGLGAQTTNKLSWADADPYLTGNGAAGVLGAAWDPDGTNPLADGDYTIKLVFTETGGISAESKIYDSNGIEMTNFTIEDDGSNDIHILDAGGNAVGKLGIDPDDLVFAKGAYDLATGATFESASFTMKLSIRSGASGNDTITFSDELTITHVSGTAPANTLGLTFQIGANGAADQRVTMYVENMNSASLGIMTPATATFLDGTTRDYSVVQTSISQTTIAFQEDARDDAIRVIDAAINAVSSTRADLGALQNRLEHTMNNLGVTKENLTAAESTIRDVDMAKEMMEYTKNSILVQASQAMLAQANMLPQGVLQLLS